MHVQVTFTLPRYCVIPRLSSLARTALPKWRLESARRIESDGARHFPAAAGPTAGSAGTEEVLTQVIFPLHLGGVAIHADSQLYAEMQECWTQMRESAVDSQATTDPPLAAAPPATPSRLQARS